MPDTKNALYAALAKLQAKLPKVGKEGEGQYGKYARLEDVSQVVMPLLGQLDLSFIARPTLQDGQLVLAYSLVHVSGEREDGVYPLVSNGTPQQMGSAITYARRYCLCAVTGVAPDSDDDDGQSAQQAAHASRQRDFRHPPPRPVSELPRNQDGSLSRSQITDEELDAAGVMTTAQQKEHTALRKGAVTGKTGGAVQRVRGPQPDDEWTTKPATDKDWFSRISEDARTFDGDGSATILRRVAEKVEAGGCAPEDAERVRTLVRARGRALALVRQEPADA